MSVPAIAVASLSPRPPRGAPIVVLGPSLGTSAAALWGRCAALLGERLDVLAWELPGHGEGAPARAPFSLSELAEGVIIAVERSLAERGHARAAFAYAGVSVGGAVGLQLLLNHPERVTAATLLGTGARIGTTAGWHDRAAEVRLRGTASIVDASAGRWFAPGFLDREPDAAAALLRALTDADRDSYAWTCEALADFDVRAWLAAIAAPVTAVAAARGTPRRWPARSSAARNPQPGPLADGVDHDASRADVGVGGAVGVGRAKLRQGRSLGIDARLGGGQCRPHPLGLDPQAGQELGRLGGGDDGLPSQ